ncbi:hypothetical protein ACPOL_2724 [Acidisarcina polymorpha]|uniref:Uncharacterized protein n=1 Tax=Acidisarcina polymorpha TaxID=2211140 RepID=A0A2Z5FZX1_9BACT|nr:hypothetical protein ACPOL_2724 [Acidisarcina polymorpha]
MCPQPSGDKCFRSTGSAKPTADLAIAFSTRAAWAAAMECYLLKTSGHGCIERSTHRRGFVFKDVPIGFFQYD